jgi:uncharacterized membrane protein
VSPRQRHWRRLTVALLAGGSVLVWGPGSWTAVVQFCAGWILGATVYVGLSWAHGVRAGRKDFRAWARDEDERLWVLTALAAAASLTSLFAIGLLLGEGRGPWRLALASLTTLCSWSLLHTVFAVHYARLFYDDTEGFRGFRFPEDCEPEFLDFAYVAFVVGMTFQVSDVVTNTSAMRRVVLAHALAAFLFNTVLMALTLSVAASFLSGATG